MPPDLPSLLALTQTPTSEGAIENQPVFHQALQRAWAMTQYGRLPGMEAGFTVDKNGAISHLDFDRGGAAGNPDGEGHLVQTISPNTLLALHTHGNSAEAQPSGEDRQAAQRLHKLIYVLSRQGLYAVTPNGQVQQVFKGLDWLNSPTHKP